MGIKVTTSDSNPQDTVYWLVGMGLQSDNYTGVTVQSQLPDEIIFDRSYIHGSNVASIQHGINANTQAFAIVDSYCDEIVDSSADAQCVTAYNGVGPFLVQNNFLEATGENIMFGGGDPAIANLVPSDITIVGNLIQKNVAWRGVVTDVKNLFELKNAQRVLLDGNVLQYTWAAAQHEALIIRSVNQSGTCSWCVVQDVTITHNLIQHAPEGIVMSPLQGPESTNPAVPLQRVKVQNNIFSDISQATWGNYGWIFDMSAFNGTDGPYMHDITLDHNTSFVDPLADANNSAFMYINCQCNAGDQIDSMALTNNLTDYGHGGLNSQGPMDGWGGGSGTGAWKAYVTGTATWNDMVFLMAAGTPIGTYPSGTSWNTIGGTGFTSVTGTDPVISGNLQLTSSSPYHNGGTDGKDIGVWDWACLNNDTAAALAGTFVPGSSGCALTASLPSGNLLPQAPTALSVLVH